MQAALIPVAYTLGTDFKPAPRTSLPTQSCTGNNGETNAECGMGNLWDEGDRPPDSISRAPIPHSAFRTPHSTGGVMTGGSGGDNLDLAWMEGRLDRSTTFEGHVRTRNRRSAAGPRQPLHRHRALPSQRQRHAPRRRLRHLNRQRDGLRGRGVGAGSHRHDADQCPLPRPNQQRPDPSAPPTSPSTARAAPPPPKRRCATPTATSWRWAPGRSGYLSSRGTRLCKDEPLPRPLP